MHSSLSAVIVGADRLGNIPDLLRRHNISILQHVSGRDPAHQKKSMQLPSGTQLVILLTDFLGHNVMKSFRCAAGQRGVPVLACRRSVCAMQHALEQKNWCEGCPQRDESLQKTRGNSDLSESVSPKKRTTQPQREATKVGSSRRAPV